MDKRILKEIAKRFAKSVLLESGTSDFAFMESGLTEDEHQYVIEELRKIGERITPLPVTNDATELVKEYYDFG